MPYNLGGGAPGGLLRSLLNTRTEAPVQAAGNRPAIAALTQEPLSKVLPYGTSQIISNKPALDLNTLEDQLRSMPVPAPEAAARLIAALVSQPPVQPASQPAPQQQQPVRSAAKGVSVNLGGLGGRVLGSQSVVGGPISKVPSNIWA